MADAPKVKRRSDGTFAKGVCGSAGRGTKRKGAVDLADLVRSVMREPSERDAKRSRLELILRDFAVALEDRETPIKDRRSLFESLMDRGYGKAVQAIQQESEMEIRFIERSQDPVGDPSAVAATRAAVAGAISASETLANHDGSPGGEDDAATPDGDGGGDEDA